MPWKCPNCKAFNFVAEAEARTFLRDKPTSTCHDCGYKLPVRKPRAERPETEVLRLARKIATKTGNRLVFPIDQSNNEVIGRAAGNLRSARSGVCPIATAEWIRMNKRGRAVARDEFEKLINERMEWMVVQQAGFLSETESRRLLAMQHEQHIDRYREMRGGTMEPPPEDASTELRKQFETTSMFQTIAKEAYQAEIRRQGGGWPGVEIAPSTAISELPLSLLTQIGKTSGGYYSLEFEAPSKMCHVVGIEVGSEGCRLMDANTGVWECSGPPQLASLIEVLVAELYSNYETYKLWHYP